MNGELGIGFDAPRIGALLDGAPPALIDQLPFGVARIAHDGRVLSFNQVESEHTGFSAASAVGLDFFSEVAPHLVAPHVRGRLDDIGSLGAVDLVLGHTGDPGDPAHLLRCRIVSARGGGYWMLTQR